MFVEQRVSDLLTVAVNGMIYGFVAADEDEEFFCTGHACIEQISLVHDKVLIGEQHYDDFEFTAL